MDESKKTVDNNSNVESENKNVPSSRVKRMRGWLGVNGGSSRGHYDDAGGSLVYGDGHSGWNR